MTLGEVSAEDSLAVMAAYTKGEDRLHMAYSFELLTDDYSAAYIRQTVEALEASIGDGWPCWAIGNHDVQRVASRWGRVNKPAIWSKCLMRCFVHFAAACVVTKGKN